MITTTHLVGSTESLLRQLRQWSTVIDSANELIIEQHPPWQDPHFQLQSSSKIAHICFNNTSDIFRKEFQVLFGQRHPEKSIHFTSSTYFSECADIAALGLLTHKTMGSSVHVSLSELLTCGKSLSETVFTELNFWFQRRAPIAIEVNLDALQEPFKESRNSLTPLGLCPKELFETITIMLQRMDVISLVITGDIPPGSTSEKYVAHLLHQFITH